MLVLRFLPPFSLALLSAIVVGCTGGDAPDASEDEDDAVEQGESDLVGTKRGSDTGSKLAKPNASYYPSRTLATLEAVGALDADTRAALLRADGIIAASPSDGKVSLDELVRLEAPEFDRVLLPNERAGRARAWKLMEAPKNAPPAYLPPAGAFAPVKNVVREVGKIDRKESIPLAKVSADVALVRVQQAFDQDGKKTTIAMADCEAALAAPAAFTPAEIETIRAARDTIARQLLAPGTARLELEPPKVETKALATIAGVKLRQVRTTTYLEERRTSPSDGPGLTGAGFLARRTSVVRFEQIPADAKLVLLRTTQLPFGPTKPVVTDEVVPLTATDPLTWAAVPAAHDWSGDEGVVEIWRGGRRRSAISLARLAEEDRLSLSDYVDFDVVAGGAPLAKNAVAIDGAKTVRFAYQTAAAPPAAGITPADLAAVATRPLDPATLPPGSYGSTYNPDGDVIDILTDKVAFHRETRVVQRPFAPPVVNEKSYRMMPAMRNVFGERKTGVFIASSMYTLVPASGMLMMPRQSYEGLGYREVWRIDAAQRATK